MNTETIEKLRATEAIYRGMFDNALEGIYQSTADGRYLIVNIALAKMYGYERPADLLAEVRRIARSARSALERPVSLRTASINQPSLTI